MLDPKLKEAFVKIRTDMHQIMSATSKAENTTKNVALAMRKVTEQVRAAATQKELTRFITKTQEKLKEIEKNFSTNKRTEQLRDVLNENKKELKEELKKIQSDIKEQNSKVKENVLEDMSTLTRETKEQQEKVRESLSKKIDKIQESSQGDVRKTVKELEKESERSKQELTDLKAELEQLRKAYTTMEHTQQVNAKELEKALTGEKNGNKKEEKITLQALPSLSVPPKKKKKNSKKSKGGIGWKIKTAIGIGVLAVGVGVFFLARFLLDRFAANLTGLTDNIFFFLIPLAVVIVIMVVIAFLLSRFMGE